MGNPQPRRLWSDGNHLLHLQERSYTRCQIKGQPHFSSMRSLSRCVVFGLSSCYVMLCTFTYEKCTANVGFSTYSWVLSHSTECTTSHFGLVRSCFGSLCKYRNRRTLQLLRGKIVIHIFPQILTCFPFNNNFF